jgi:hypothetical protein
MRIGMRQVQSKTCGVELADDDSERAAAADSARCGHSKPLE